METESRVLSLGACLPAHAGVEHDDVGLDLAELLVAEADSFRGARGEVLDDDVGPLDHLVRDGETFGLGEIDGDAELDFDSCWRRRGPSSFRDHRSTAEETGACRCDFSVSTRKTVAPRLARSFEIKGPAAIQEKSATLRPSKSLRSRRGRRDGRGEWFAVEGIDERLVLAKGRSGAVVFDRRSRKPRERTGLLFSVDVDPEFSREQAGDLREDQEPN